MKKFIGMMREPWDSFCKNSVASGFRAGFIRKCSCGKDLFAELKPQDTAPTFEDLREHWQAGHFDVPIYEDIQIHESSFEEFLRAYEEIAKRYKIEHSCDNKCLNGMTIINIEILKNSYIITAKCNGCHSTVFINSQK